MFSLLAPFEPSDDIAAFLAKNEDFIKSHIESASNGKEAAYWHQVSLVEHQLRGLYDGYSTAVLEGGGAGLDIAPLTLMDIRAINLVCSDEPLNNGCAYCLKKPSYLSLHS